MSNVKLPKQVNGVWLVYDEDDKTWRKVIKRHTGEEKGRPDLFVIAFGA